jgi:hypothetical protein
MRVGLWERTPLGIGRSKLEGVWAQLKAAREEATKTRDIKTINLHANVKR